MLPPRNITNIGAEWGLSEMKKEKEEKKRIEERLIDI